MKKTVMAISCCAALVGSVYADEFEAYRQQQFEKMQQEQKLFSAHKRSQEEEFKAYRAELDKAYADYKKELEAVWDEPKMASKKEWVGYSQDKMTRTAVDFEAGSIEIETISGDERSGRSQLQQALAKIATQNVAQVQQSDPLLQKISAISKKNGVAATAQPEPEPLLATTLFAQPPTKKSLKSYVDKTFSTYEVKTEASKINKAKVYSIRVKLPDNAMQQRSKTHLSSVKKNAKRFDVPMPLLFAVIHTESAFNPMARSPIPAYGLMQIVPSSAGADTYDFLYKQKRQPSASYLYNSSKNIEMGAAYLHILYYRYLKQITNPTSRLYCAIAAYNTGAGNVAYAWTGKHNITQAAQLINRQSPEEVYEHLLRHLKYEEPKHYLRRVDARMSQYYKVYGDSTAGQL
jgi:membrane-bound lytic murein transglycosylase C